MCFYLFSFSFVYFLLYGSGNFVNELLGLFQTQTGNLLNDLYDLELSLSGGGEDNVELSLLSLSGCSACCGRGFCYCSCGCRLDAIFFLEYLCEFLNLFNCEVY